MCPCKACGGAKRAVGGKHYEEKNDENVKRNIDDIAGNHDCSNHDCCSSCVW